MAILVIRDFLFSQPVLGIFYNSLMNFNIRKLSFADTSFTLMPALAKTKRPAIILQVFNFHFLTKL